MKKKETIFDRIATGTPVNKTAAGVVSSGGRAWEPEKPPPPGYDHWKAPPAMKAWEGPDRRGLTANLTGTKIGRIIVIGILDDAGRSRGLRWVVKCLCGDYEVRSSKALKRMIAGGADTELYSRCYNCARLLIAQKRYASKGARPLDHFIR